MANESTNRVAVVTGASRGIGQAIAIALAAAGHPVALLARNGDAVEAAANSIIQSGGKAIAIRCDLTDFSQIIPALSTARARLEGTISILINNAGYGGPIQYVDQIDDEEWSRVMRLNIEAPLRLSRAILPEMRDKQFGRIVNVTSILAHRGGAGSGAYVASKHALLGLTRTIALEFARFNITCNDVAAGFVDTEMFRTFAGTDDERRRLAERNPSGRIATAEDVAAAVAFLCGESARQINGTSIVVDGGESAKG